MEKLEKAWSYIYDFPLKICCTNFQPYYIFLPAKISLSEKENFKNMKNFVINIAFSSKKLLFFCLFCGKSNCNVFDFPTRALLAAKCNREITFDKCDYEAHHDLQSSSSTIVGQMQRKRIQI